MTTKECGRIQHDSPMATKETFLMIHPSQTSTILFQMHTHGCHIKEIDVSMRK